MLEVSLGERIFTNRLKVYGKDYSDENTLTFNQMMNKYLLPEDDSKYVVNVESAIFSCFEFEDILMAPLFENKIPTTIFEDKLKRSDPEIFIQAGEINSNKVNVYKYETVPYASFHSKTMFYEFDDRLRVIINSGNLTRYMWNKV